MHDILQFVFARLPNIYNDSVCVAAAGASCAIGKHAKLL
jgi:hypothetical protein